MFQSYRSLFQAFPKIQMLHTGAVHDEIFNSEFPTDGLPESLRSFVVGYTEEVKLTEFLTKLFASLECLTLVCMRSRAPSNYELLFHCRNLQRLSFYHEGDIEFSFLQSMPHLRYLSDFSECGICVEDAAVISRDAPNLHSLTFLLAVSDNTDKYFEKLGRELCFVKSLMFSGEKPMFRRFLRVFLSDHSLFRQVTSVRLLEHTSNSEDLDISNKTRPQSTISHFVWRAEQNGELCDICWGKRTSNWKCVRCQSFVFALQ